MESKAVLEGSGAARGVALPSAIFALSFAIYAGAAIGAVLVGNMGGKITLAVLAGTFIANLAIIGHDAVHRSFTRLRWLNRLIGTLAFLPALHPYGRWEHHHNRIHHCYTAQLGVDNAYPPMTPDDYRAASPARRLYYRFMRSLIGQPFFYLLDIWAIDMFVPFARARHGLKASDWRDIAIVYLWLVFSMVGLAALSLSENGGSIRAALWNGGVYGILIPFLVWNVFISFVTIVQHTGPQVRWVVPTGRFSTHEERLGGTVHVVFPEVLDWFFHRVMQHVVHHVNPIIPLYRLKKEEKKLFGGEPAPIVETWTPLYHWRMTRDCKLYDPRTKSWRRFPAARGRLKDGAA
ncbi:MAG TPA: fatty acid desaturase, partial [Rhizomicrobium sp.]|nr:fatty acid desaturase [Rhizomicrobium sp.]